MKFQIGDHVRVVHLTASEWDRLSGVVTKIVERPADAGRDPVQECAVQFSSGRRWFLAEHLARTIPDKTLRFFRAELLERWTDLSPDDVSTVNGDREELTAFLQERFGFGLRRASAEANEFMRYFENRLRSATENSQTVLNVQNRWV
jgi:hypothetical protein